MGTGTSIQFDLGHWILRLIALIIDSIILGVIAWVLLFILLVPVLFTGAFSGLWAAWGFWLGYPFAIGILSVLYYLVLDVWWGGDTGQASPRLRGSNDKWRQNRLRAIIHP